MVILDERHGKTASSIAFAGSTKAGAMHDEKGRFGTAEMVARLLNRGTESGLTSSEVSDRVEELGATLQFSNYDESVGFTARCHARNGGRLLEILADCLANPSFPGEEVEKTRAEVIANLEEERDETRTTAYRELAALVFGREKPYGRNTLGSLQDIKRLTREELKAFHEAHYSPDSTILVATGSFDSAELLAAVEDSLGGLTRPKSRKSGGDGKRASAASAEEPGGGEASAQLVKVPMEHKSQVDLALGSRAVPRTSEEFYALNLGNLMLGRIGLYGRLGKNVRDEKGLAYYCYSMIQARLYAGSFAVYAGVNPINVTRAVEGITRELQRMCSEPLSEQEMSTARRNLTGTLSIALESSNERATLIHDMEYFGLGLDYLDRYGSILESVTPERVMRLFDKYCNLDLISLVGTGPVGSSKIVLPKEIAPSLGSMNA